MRVRLVSSLVGLTDYGYGTVDVVRGFPRVGCFATQNISISLPSVGRRGNESF